MNAPDQIGAKRIMNGAVAGQPALPGKRGAAQKDVEMTFAPLAKPRMATMAFTVIDNLKLARRECRQQFRMYFRTNLHFILFPSSKLRQNP